LLLKALDGILTTPSGRAYAEKFLAEGLTAVVHFAEFPDSRALHIGGRKTFTGPRAYTDWLTNDVAEIRLNANYVGADSDYSSRSLPGVLAHELLGHAAWYSRAERADQRLVFHHHELNEAMARLTGWIVEYELNGQFEGTGAWRYLDDPARYLSQLKLKLPYYARTFNSREMADAASALRERLPAARAEVVRAEQVLNQQLALDAKVTDSPGAPPKELDSFQREQADLVASYRDELANAEAVVEEIQGMLRTMAGEADHYSVTLLREGVGHPLFQTLAAEVAREAAVLKRLVEKTKASSAAKSTGPSVWTRIFRGGD
ncbi:MAG: hypothetical protein HYZ74_06165, partial [Elusimicrobia bacterium]|nr:hypothetical protein [Elusimicrobiota bacterium]